VKSIMSRSIAAAPAGADEQDIAVRVSNSAQMIQGLAYAICQLGCRYQLLYLKALTLATPKAASRDFHTPILKGIVEMHTVRV